MMDKVIQFWSSGVLEKDTIKVYASNMKSGNTKIKNFSIQKQNDTFTLSF